MNTEMENHMLELVRYQEKKLQSASGAEYEILSGSQIMESEKNKHGVK